MKSVLHDLWHILCNTTSEMGRIVRPNSVGVLDCNETPSCRFFRESSENIPLT